MIKQWKLSRLRKSVAFVATTYNIWEVVVSSGSLLYGPRFAFAPWACQIFSDRPLLERLKLLRALLRSQTASKLPTAVHQDQGAPHDVVQLAGITAIFISFATNHTLATQHVRGKMFNEKKFRRLNFHLLP